MSQLADISIINPLFVRKGILKITEVKEGAMTLEALNILEHHPTGDEPVDVEKLTSAYDVNLAKQVMRIHQYR